MSVLLWFAVALFVLAAFLLVLFVFALMQTAKRSDEAMSALLIADMDRMPNSWYNARLAAISRQRNEYFND